MAWAWLLFGFLVNGGMRFVLPEMSKQSVPRLDCVELLIEMWRDDIF